MKANHQSKTGDVAQPYFKQRRFLREARGGQPGPGRRRRSQRAMMILAIVGAVLFLWTQPVAAAPGCVQRNRTDRKSTRLNSSHTCSSYAIFCLKKKTV